MILVKNIALVLSIIVILIVSIAALPYKQEVQKVRKSKPTQSTPTRRIVYLTEPDSISGGIIAGIKEFPWTAMLLYDNSVTGMAQCGGVLINRNYVVTAAHCVVDGMNIKRPLKYVRLREYDINNDPDCEVEDEVTNCSETKIDMEPRNIRIHPLYNVSDPNWYHDIALIEIDTCPPYSDFLQPIHLPEPETRTGMTVGDDLVLAGWGRTDIFKHQIGSNRPSPVKLKVHLPYVEPETCKNTFLTKTTLPNFELGSAQICAGGIAGKDACLGDSGSPLMFYDVEKKVWILSGIVSIGIHDCTTRGIPGVYTNIRGYLNWIKYHAGKEKP